MYPTGRAGRAARTPEEKEARKKKLKAKVGLAEHPQMVGDSKSPRANFRLGPGRQVEDCGQGRAPH